jgi:hypothetical protein
MRVESFAIRLRPRANLEAVDLGVRLCQSTAGSVYRCYIAVALPWIAIALATVEFASWLPSVLVWLAKPWFDRTILFVLSRAAFGEPTTLRDVWREQKQVWWSQLFRTLIWQRLSMWRSLTQPVIQLEGLRGAALRERIKTIRAGKSRSATYMTGAFSSVENLLWFALISLAFWFAPPGHEPNVLGFLYQTDEPLWMSAVFAATYSAIVLFVEPFYVASGFALYLNRRVELEAWDIEQEFRRAFAREDA